MLPGQPQLLWEVPTEGVAEEEEGEEGGEVEEGEGQQVAPRQSWTTTSRYLLELVFF